MEVRLQRGSPRARLVSCGALADFHRYLLPPPLPHVPSLWPWPSLSVTLTLLVCPWISQLSRCIGVSPSLVVVRAPGCFGGLSLVSVAPPPPIHSDEPFHPSTLMWKAVSEPPGIGADSWLG